MFHIKTIYAVNHDSSFGGDPWKVIATVEMLATEWKKEKQRDALGQLYGIDISNRIHSLNGAIPAYEPMVDDRRRSVRGVKTIVLTYFLKDADKAEKLGLKVKRFKNGEVLGGFNEHVCLFKRPEVV